MQHNPYLSLDPDLQPGIIAQISKLLAPDFEKARDSRDLQRRLAAKGYQIRRGYLATLPQGKLICPISRL